MVTAAPSPGGFTEQQKEYLSGFLAGALTAGPAPGAGAPTPAAAPEERVFGTPVSDLSKPERWKLEEDPLEIWEKLCAHAAAGKFPDEADAFRFKFHGLFHVAPAQDSFMIRLRIPAGEIHAHQLRGLADLAEECGNGHADITTRANLQLRELPPRAIVRVLTRVSQLGLTSRGAGADNIRNLTATPTSGFDPRELIDVRPFAHALHHAILNQRELYGLPRKFNVAFDSGGTISAAADTNDIGFFAVRITETSLATLNPQLSTARPAPGIYFRCELGGITGHKDFARDTGLLLTPEQLVPVATAMIRVFREHGDRTDRKKARLKYLLERWHGHEKFLEETQKKLPFPLLRLPRAAGEPRAPVDKRAHLGLHPQAQPGRFYLGIGVPVGRLTAAQMRALAALAERHGTGELRLTVWQSLLLPHLSAEGAAAGAEAVRGLGLYTDPHATAGCVIACTGNRGCKYAGADTKSHARAVAAHLRTHGPALTAPVNLHLTGCPHSCAQHYCGDLGGVATKLPDGREGYHVVLGGGMDQEQGIAREIFRHVAAADLPALVSRTLATFAARRTGDETFVQWTRRHSVEELKALLA
ncbi:NirA family protein [Oleiharenicola sp. Vm1]|uniref:NirA family protein n=1 Tax=Oleiharenicola sp. Vm1 TaxID=3398393 RepID=UPI0039F5FE7A